MSINHEFKELSKEDRFTYITGNYIYFYETGKVKCSIIKDKFADRLNMDNRVNEKHFIYHENS